MYRWEPLDLIRFFEASLHLRHAEGLKDVCQALRSMALRSGQVLGPQSGKLAPSPATIRKLYLSIDVAMMLLERRSSGASSRNGDGGGAPRYVHADSSPQGHRDWLLAKSTIVDADLLTLFEAANNLARFAIQQHTASPQELESAGAASGALPEVALRWQEVLESGMREHVHVPAAMGLRQTNVAHKSASLLHSFLLESQPGAIQAQLRDVVSFTADLGVEIGIPGFRVSYRDLVPPWQKQVLQELTVDGVGVAGGKVPDRPEQQNDLEADVDCVVVSGSAVAGQGCQGAGDHEKLHGGSAPVPEAPCSQPSDGSSSAKTLEAPCDLLSEAWRRHPEWRHIFLPFAIAVPGMLHICNNLLQDVDFGMAGWEDFWSRLKNVAALLCDQMRLDRLRATCLEKGDGAGSHVPRHVFVNKLNKLRAPRWGSVTKFVRDAHESITWLRCIWKESLYGSASEEGQGVHFNPEYLTETLQNPMFMAYMDMVLQVHSCIEELVGWSEGCPCHPPPWQQSHRPKCCMQGRRAPEMAAGSWKQVLDQLFKVSVGELARTHFARLSKQQWSTLIGDLEHAKACAQTGLSIKLSCWDKLPWHLCGLAHHDPAVACECARKCLVAFDETPEALQGSHHPLTLVFLELDSPGRAALVIFASAQAAAPQAAAAPRPFLLLVARLKFISIVERIIEAKHKDVKRALSNLTRHSAPRVSMAIRSNQFVLVAQRPDADLEALCDALVEAQSSCGLAALGLNMHPDILAAQTVQTDGRTKEARTSIARIARAIIYRCDVEAQFLDYSLATRADEEVKRKEQKSADKHAQVQPKKTATWDDLIGNSTLAYLRQQSSEPTAAPPVFSIHVGKSLRWEPLEASLAAGPLAAAVIASNGLQELEIDVEATATGQGHSCQPCPDLIFFTPLEGKSSNPSRMRTVPTAAAVQDGVSADSLTAIQRVCVGSLDDGRRPLVCIGPSGRRLQRDAVLGVLSNFRKTKLQREPHQLLEWQREEGKIYYSLPGLHYAKQEQQSRLSELLQAMLTAGAVAPDQDGEGPKARPTPPSKGQGGRAPAVKFCAAESDGVIFHDLQAQGYASTGGFAFDFALTQVALESLEFSVALHSPRPVVAPAPCAAPESMSTLHLLQQLLSEGWQWELKTQTAQRQAPPYAAGGNKVFYTAGATAERSYLRALLKATELFNKDTAAFIAHGYAAEEYEALFSAEAGAMVQIFAKRPKRNPPLVADADVVGGPTKRQRLSVFEDLVEYAAKSSATDGRAAAGQGQGNAQQPLQLQQDADAVRVATSGNQRPRGPHPKAKAAAPLVQPHFFEWQQGAMCGLHALNNAVGIVAKRRTFTEADVADGLKTLEQEYERDRLPWNVREHASPSGDYSYALLNWILLRRQVLQPMALQFMAHHLTALDQPGFHPEMLMADGCFGGLVHVARGRLPASQDGHWVSFARPQGGELFFWMDSITGFRRLSFAELVAELKGKQFALLSLLQRDAAPAQAQDLPPLPPPPLPPPPGIVTPPKAEEPKADEPPQTSPQLADVPEKAEDHGRLPQPSGPLGRFR